MTLILNIETSTKVCSVALALNGKTIIVKEELGVQYIHSEKLTVFIEELINESEYSISDLSAICVSKGPGSYTGLRIGVSCAKGLCYSLGIPLLSIDSLTILAYFFKQNYKIPHSTVAYPMIDARRMEVFTQKMTATMSIRNSIEAMILNEDSFSNSQEEIYLFGDGANKLEGIIKNKKVKIFKQVETSARGMEKLSFQKYKDQCFEDVAYFEPYYLKEFIAIPSKKKML